MATKKQKKQAKSKKAKRKVYDWEAIEREYRAGQLSVSEIARQFDISRAYINKKSKQLGWERDLTNQVRARINAKLVADQVSGCNTREAVDTAVDRGFEIIKLHRKDAAQQRTFLAELTVSLIDRINKIKELRLNGDAKEEYLELDEIKHTSIIVRNSAQALKSLVDIERQAFNLNDLGSLPLELNKPDLSGLGKEDLETLREIATRATDSDSES